MPQLRSLVALLLAAAAITGVATAPPPANRDFQVLGQVYCDECRAGFQIKEASHFMKGAKVEMECRHFETQDLQFKAEATTDAGGCYQMPVGGDHQEEICEVALVGSPERDCAETAKFRDRSRVPLTWNNGMDQSKVRYANPVAFLRKEPRKDCGQILRKYGLYNETSENP